jgi:hypothetical protein
MERSRNGRTPRSIENRLLAGIGVLGAVGLVVIALLVITDPGSSRRSSIQLGPTSTTRSRRLPDTGPPLQLGPIPTSSTSTTTTTISPAVLEGLARLKLAADLQALARATTTTTTRPPVASAPPPTTPPTTAPPPSTTSTIPTTTTTTKPEKIAG